MRPRIAIIGDDITTLITAHALFYRIPDAVIRIYSLLEENCVDGFTPVSMYKNHSYGEATKGQVKWVVDDVVYEYGNFIDVWSRVGGLFERLLPFRNIRQLDKIPATEWCRRVTGERSVEMLWKRVIGKTFGHHMLNKISAVWARKEICSGTIIPPLILRKSVAFRVVDNVSVATLRSEVEKLGGIFRGRVLRIEFIDGVPTVVEENGEYVGASAVIVALSSREHIGAIQIFHRAARLLSFLPDRQYICLLLRLRENHNRAGHSEILNFINDSILTRAYILNNHTIYTTITVGGNRKEIQKIVYRLCGIAGIDTSQLEEVSISKKSHFLPVIGHLNVKRLIRRTLPARIVPVILTSNTIDERIQAGYRVAQQVSTMLINQKAF